MCIQPGVVLNFLTIWASLFLQQQQGEQEFGDYEAVLQYVEYVILEQKTAVSMKKLHEIYKLYLDDTRYRHKLRLQLKETFSEKKNSSSSQVTGDPTKW